MIARGKRVAQRNASSLVTNNNFEWSTESAKFNVNYSALSELHDHCVRLPGATRLTLFGACPLAVTFRAFGAGRLAKTIIIQRTQARNARTKALLETECAMRTSIQPMVCLDRKSV